MSESALVVCVPAAEPHVGALRERHDPVARRGMPPHLTVLYPFVAPGEITPAVLARVQDALRTIRAFDFELADLGRFPDTVWLAPSRTTPFVALTTTIAAAFPAHPPYGGRFATIVPHLTVAHTTGDASAIENELRSNLQRLGPVRTSCTTVELVDDTSGRWQIRHRFALPS